MRPRLIPVGGATRWDEGELARALPSLDDQAVFERCETLLDLAWVRERALDSSKHARAIALRGWVRSIAVDPSGQYIGVGAGSGEIQIWDPRHGVRWRSPRASTGSSRGLPTAPSGSGH